MLATALGRNAGHGALNDLEQSLLHPFAGNVAGDGGGIRLPGDLVDLVDVDNAAAGPLYVVVRGLQQVNQDVLHILSHIPCLGKRGGVSHGEWHVERPGQGLCHEGFATARGADEDDVALLQLHLGMTVNAVSGINALVVVVDRHRQHFFGVFLAHHILVHVSLDLHGLQGGSLGLGLDGLLAVLADDLIA